MPGLAKAIRRRNRVQELSPRAIFDWHQKYLGALLTSPEGPLLVAGVYCDEETFHRYQERLRRVVRARIRTTGDYFALDLFGARRAVGRLMTNLRDDTALPMLVAALDAGQHTEMMLKVFRAEGPSEGKSMRLPVGIDRVSEEEFHGPPTVVGEGEYGVMTINTHDGSIYVQNFLTEEEAEAQLERNQAANEPFVGAALD